MYYKTAMVTTLFRLAILALFTLTIFTSRPAAATDFFLEPELSSFYTSNVYLNEQKEWDIALIPQLDTGIDFADFWTAGYSGKVDLYTQHSDLLAHKHEIYVFANPAWGDENEDEFFARLSCTTQRNSDTYSAINHLTPRLDLRLEIEPETFFRWALSQNLAYRWFYNDETSSSLDAWTFGTMTFTAQTRTTLSPRIGFGYRHYTDQPQGQSNDISDLQLEAGIHMSQGLWEQAGLQADYAYVHAFDDSVLIARKFNTFEFSYIGEDFLYTGHKAYLGFKQLFESGLRFGLGFRFDLKSYGGWTAINPDGTESNEDRQDERLGPDIWLEYVYWPEEDAPNSVPEFKASIYYSYLRQISNDVEYDTDQHVAGINLGLGWLL